MTHTELSLWISLGALLAGFLGALTGLGGGIVIIPLLTLVLGVDIRYAIGTSLVTVIATSSGAAAAFVREGFTNIRIGMFLELATVMGALFGAFIAIYLDTHLIATLFGLVLLFSAWSASRINEAKRLNLSEDPLAARLKLDGHYPLPDGTLQHYHVQSVIQGFGLMGLAGILSAILGLGSGTVKVVAMDQMMKIPFKVSTTTSNFMIGVTAAASAGIYLKRGYIDPGLCLPVIFGVLTGAWLGAKLLPRIRNQALRRIFAVVIFLVGLEMIYNGLTHRL